MSPSAFLSMAGSVLGLLGLLGAAVAVLASTRQRTTIQTLKDDNDALRGRVDTIETLEQECKVRLAKAELTVKVLTDTVTNAQAVAELLARVDLQHADIRALGAEVKSNFAEVLTRLAEKASA